MSRPDRAEAKQELEKRGFERGVRDRASRTRSSRTGDRDRPAGGETARARLDGDRDGLQRAAARSRCRRWSAAAPTPPSRRLRRGLDYSVSFEQSHEARAARCSRSRPTPAPGSRSATASRSSSPRASQKVDGAERGRRSALRRGLDPAGRRASRSRSTAKTTSIQPQDGRVTDQFPAPGRQRGERADRGDDLRRRTLTADRADHPDRRRPTRPTHADESRGPHRAGAPASMRSRCAPGAAVAAGLREAGHEVIEVLIARDGRRGAAARRAGRAGARRRACSASTSPSRSSTAPSARTARSRACSSASTSPTSAPTCSPRRSAWTS